MRWNVLPVQKRGCPYRASEYRAQSYSSVVTLSLQNKMATNTWYERLRHERPHLILGCKYFGYNFHQVGKTQSVLVGGSGEYYNQRDNVLWFRRTKDGLIFDETIRMLVQRKDHASAVIGSTIYAFGGYYKGSSRRDMFATRSCERLSAGKKKNERNDRRS